MAGKKPDYRVCVSKSNEDKSASRTTEVGAGWVGDKGQINVRLNVPAKVVGEFLAEGYDFVFFENGN